MKLKHLIARGKQAENIAACSNCPRRKVGCVILNAERNVIISDAYNGFTRGGPPLCGGEICLRDQQDIPSGVGSQNDVGCLHAEMGAICNAAAQGVSTLDCWMMITIPPCLLCAKLIHHCGIKKLWIVGKGYSTEGSIYLSNNNVEVEYLEDLIGTEQD